MGSSNNDEFELVSCDNCGEPGIVRHFMNDHHIICVANIDQLVDQPSSTPTSRSHTEVSKSTPTVTAAAAAAAAAARPMDGVGIGGAASRSALALSVHASPVAAWIPKATQVVTRPPPSPSTMASPPPLPTTSPIATPSSLSSSSPSPSWINRSNSGPPPLELDPSLITTLATTARSEWTCPACTLINDPAVAECSVCETRRPPLPLGPGPTISPSVPSVQTNPITTLTTVSLPVSLPPASLTVGPPQAIPSTLVLTPSTPSLRQTGIPQQTSGFVLQPLPRMVTVGPARVVMNTPTTVGVPMNGKRKTPPTPSSPTSPANISTIIFDDTINKKNRSSFISNNISPLNSINSSSARGRGRGRGRSMTPKTKKASTPKGRKPKGPQPTMIVNNDQTNTGSHNLIFSFDCLSQDDDDVYEALNLTPLIVAVATNSAITQNGFHDDNGSTIWASPLVEQHELSSSSSTTSPLSSTSIRSQSNGFPSTSIAAVGVSAKMASRFQYLLNGDESAWEIWNTCRELLEMQRTGTQKCQPVVRALFHRIIHKRTLYRTSIGKYLSHPVSCSLDSIWQ
jgi:hypothetical protein